MALPPGVKRQILTIAVVAVVALATWWQQRADTSPAQAPGRAPDSAPNSAPEAAPEASGGPARALSPIPGGSLRAHEEVGGHTLERHVGRSEPELRSRLKSEGKREVSSFPDVAGAERAVAEVLRRRRADVEAWVKHDPQGSEDFSARLDEPAGVVLRQGDARPRPGRTVVVVLAPSRRFAEGFRVVTAYVRLP